MNNEQGHLEVANIEEINPSMSDLVQTKGLIQTKAQYTTAVQILHPRNLEKIIKRVEQEAELAGEDFYYSYPQGGKFIEGPGINGAQIVARNWGNCAVNTRPIDNGNEIIVFADFVDFETGFNLTRAYLGKKKILKNKQGKEIYDRDRNDEIVFQVMVSKATRNVILNAVPNYVVDAGLKRAKEGLRKKLEGYIKNNGFEQAREKIAERAARLNVTAELLEEHFGKPKTWKEDKLLRISTVLKGIEDGYTNINDAFPEKEAPEEKPKPQKKTVKLKPEAATETDKDPHEQPKNKPAKKTEKKPEEKPAQATKTTETDWGSPNSIIETIYSKNTISELADFKMEARRHKISQVFTGSDYDTIVEAIEKKEQSLTAR